MSLTSQDLFTFCLPYLLTLKYILKLNWIKGIFHFFTYYMFVCEGIFYSWIDNIQNKHKEKFTNRNIWFSKKNIFGEKNKLLKIKKKLLRISTVHIYCWSNLIKFNVEQMNIMFSVNFLFISFLFFKCCQSEKSLRVWEKNIGERRKWNEKFQ